MKTAWLSETEIGSTWTPQVINRLEAVRSLGDPSRTVRLGDACKIESGQYVRHYVEPGPRARGILPYIRVDNIRPFVANMNPEDLAYVRRGDPAVLGRSVIAENDVVIARTGTLGKATLAVGEIAGCVASQHITRITVDPQYSSKLSPEFICAFLNYPSGRAQLIAGGTGSTRLELTHERLADVRLPVAPGAMGTLTRLVRDGSADLAAAGEMMRAAIGLYNQFIIVAGLKAMPRRGTVWVEPHEVLAMWTPRYFCGGELPWEEVTAAFDVRSLGEMAQIQRGKGTRTRHYSESGIPFVRTTSLINGGIDPFPDHYASAEVYEEFNQPVEEGDILLSIEGKIGQVAYLTSNDQCVFKNHIVLIRPADRSLSADIFLALSSEVGQIQMRRLTVIQATLPGLAGRSRTVLIPIPRGEDAAGVELYQAARETLVRGLDMRRKAIQELRAAASSVGSILT